MLPPDVSDQWLELLDEPAALVAHHDGTILAVNNRFAAALSLAATIVVGTTLARLISGDDAEDLSAAVASPDSASVLLRFQVRDAASPPAFGCWFGPARAGCRLLRLSPPPDVAVAGVAVADVAPAPHHAAEVVALRQKLAWFREAVDKVGHSVVVFDAQDRLVLCNKFYRDGYRSGDRVLPPDIALEGKTYRELMELRVRYRLHKEFADDPTAFIADRVKRFEEGRDCITYLATGRVVRSQYRRLSAGNRVYISTDITELVEKEEKQRATELAYRTKSQFLANMSHELRTPLNAILGFSQLIRDASAGPLDSRYRSYADDIHIAGQHLLNLINDILDLSKIEVGRMSLREGPVDIAELVRKCCRLLHERAQEDCLVLKQDVPADIPHLLADELRLKQIILNLLSNSIKFTPYGGHIRVAALPRSDGGLDLSVSDTGIGMHPDDINAALTPFQQIDRGFHRAHDGTGLGLPLAKTLTELHGARFEIASVPAAGTVVTIAMPPERILPRPPLHVRGGAA